MLKRPLQLSRLYFRVLLNILSMDHHWIMNYNNLVFPKVGIDMITVEPLYNCGHIGTGPD